MVQKSPSTTLSYASFNPLCIMYLSSLQKEMTLQDIANISTFVLKQHKNITFLEALLWLSHKKTCKLIFPYKTRKKKENHTHTPPCCQKHTVPIITTTTTAHNHIPKQSKIQFSTSNECHTFLWNHFQPLPTTAFTIYAWPYSIGCLEPQASFIRRRIVALRVCAL